MLLAISLATQKSCCLVQVSVHPFSLHFEHPVADCVPAAADSVRGYSKKKSSTYVHFQLFRILFIVFGFLFASLLSLSCNRRSRMSGEDRRLACAHAHVNAINPAFKAR